MKLTDIINEEYQEVKEEQIVLPAKYEETNEVKAILKLFEKELCDIEKEKLKGFAPIPSNLYFFLKSSIRTLPLKTITPQDITSFLLALKKYNERDSPNSSTLSESPGIFLSALIHEHQRKNNFDGTYIIPTEQLKEKINYLGIYNNANMHIIGSIGSYGFLYMKKGNVIIDGHTEYALGHKMQNGSIQINGNTEDSLCRKMYGGTVIIKGNAGENACSQMSGGTVTIQGNTKGYTGIGMKGGNLFLQGNKEKFVGIELKGGTIHLQGSSNHEDTYRKYGTIIHKGNVIFHKEPLYKKIFWWLK